MEWDNLKNEKCPKCAAFLKKDTMYFCNFCSFRISFGKVYNILGMSPDLEKAGNLLEKKNEKKCLQSKNFREALLNNKSPVYKIKVDALNFPESLLNKLRNGSVRTVQRLKSMPDKKRAKLGLTDNEVKLINTKVNKLFKESKNIVSDKCLKCGSMLILKEGKFGKFMGCEKYPKCDFTKSLN